MKGKRISDEQRAVVIAALLEGQAVTKVAEQFKLPHSTVSRLKKAIPQEQLDEVGRKKAENIAALISANLEGSFEAIQNILKVTNDDNWLHKQPASELATFLGVTSDKVFRVLEAIENAQHRNEAND